MTIDTATLLRDLRPLLADLREDLLARAQLPGVRAGLLTAHNAEKAAQRTADPFDAWCRHRATQVVAAWVLSVIFVRTLEDRDFLDRRRIAGPGAEDSEQQFMTLAPFLSMRDYLLTVFRELAQLPGAAALFDGRHNPVWVLGPSAGAARRLVDFFRKQDSDGSLLYDFSAKDYTFLLRPDAPGFRIKAAEASKELGFDFTGGHDGPGSRLDVQAASQRLGFDPTFKTSSPGSRVDTQAALQRLGIGDTRFLGDIYQDLDEEVRKRYALLQTPDFVESFILDDTLDPAIRTFGLEKVRLIDPTCGSGHFLLGAFARLHAAWREAEPATDPQILAQRAIDQVYGVDLNPYAVAIARFRLTVAFLEASGIRRLADAPPLNLNLCVADSLLHGVSGQATHFDSLLSQDDYADDSARQFWGADLFALEDKAEALRILGKRYHVVVGNPPYINVQDAKLRDEYRKHYKACHRGYQLVAPFVERFFDLAAQRGYVGAIVGNGFMKREFGTKLIVEVLPRHDLTKVVDTSGAYIPGHGTPTVILFGRRQPPSDAPVLAVMGKRGEPSTPDDPANGEVWSSIRDHHNDLGFENDYISIAEVDRQTFYKHPWTLSGGGAADLKQLLEERAEKRLEDIVESPIGRAARTGDDEAFVRPHHVVTKAKLDRGHWLELLRGEEVRDWGLSPTELVWYPYLARNNFKSVAPDDSDWRADFRYFWPLRTKLADRATFQGKIADAGLHWYEYMQYTPSANRTPLSIAFAFVATHNHFVLDRGGKVFKQTAPIIKLPEDATEEDHLALLGYLNSSTACFWMKQVCQGKHMADGGAAHADPASQRYEFDGSKLSKAPLPPSLERFGVVCRIAAKLCEAAERREALMPREALDRWYQRGEHTLILELDGLRHVGEQILARMCAIQEELDWEVYETFDLLTTEDRELLRRARGEALPDYPRTIDTNETLVARQGLYPGHRPFEVVLARDSLANDTPTAWFDRNGYASPGTIRDEYAPSCQRLIDARVAIIDRNSNIRLVEKPEFKRRWTLRDFDAELREAGIELLLNAAERHFAAEVAPCSAEEISRAVLGDAKLVQVAEVLFPESGDLARDVEGCLREAAVPYVSAQLLTEKGLEKHAVWQRAWTLQRREDCGEAVDEIPVPPKLDTKDYSDITSWRLRGKFNVPKERFISYRGAESDEDPSPLFGWAGWNHLERAQALAAFYQRRKLEDGWDFERLTPLLVGLWELVPWLKQWHNEPSAEFGGARMGEFFEDFVNQQVREAGKTVEDLEAWRPEKRVGRGGQRRADGMAVKTSSGGRGGGGGEPGRKPKVTAEALLEAVKTISAENGGEGAAQTDVAELLGVSGPAVAKVADVLVESGKLELLSKRPKVFLVVQDPSDGLADGW